jgi:hypothetical protein
VRTTAERAERLARLRLVTRLAVDDPVEHDDRVAAEHRLGRSVTVCRASLAQRVLDRHLGRIVALLQLTRVGDPDGERDPQAL